MAMRLSAKARRMIAAYLTDRADQYKTDSGSWIPLIDAAVEVMNGEFEQRVAEGELDDPELLSRVEKWRSRPAPKKGAP